MKTNFVLKTALNSLKNLQTILAVSWWQRLYFIFLQTCLNGRQKLTFLSRNFNSGFCPINRPNRRVRDIIETELNLTFQKTSKTNLKKPFWKPTEWNVENKFQSTVEVQTNTNNTLQYFFKDLLQQSNFLD
jgi:hypothetical protein